ncbi:MAG: hydrogenase formation protein HypD [bacterium]
MMSESPASRRDLEQSRRLVETIKSAVTRDWRIMEICGGQTHAILRHGLDQLLPQQIELVHGPGCPVCVTPIVKIDQAVQIAQMPEVILCSLGDMLRVPGSQTDLLSARAAGAEVRIVYSPLDAVAIAKAHSDKQVVLFAIGFETTAPLNALAVLQAEESALENFSILSAQVLVPPALEAILADPECRINALLAAGHVCAVMGYTEYESIAQRHNLPIVVTGFEPTELLRGVLAAVRQLEGGEHEVENQYPRAVQREGNLEAQRLMNTVFAVVDSEWRGLGVIPHSGLALRDKFSRFDAERRFGIQSVRRSESSTCRAGEVLQGKLRPDQCQSFGRECTPERPLGAPMVSAEGACAAYYQAGKANRL